MVLKLRGFCFSESNQFNHIGFKNQTDGIFPQETDSAIRH